LFRAALRGLGGLFNSHGYRLEVDFRALKEAAGSVRRVEHCFEPFRQRKLSTRNKGSHVLHGAVGGGVYADVPWGLVPWMLWAGRLHVGAHRVAGAGGWRLLLL